ncbi:MAG TPA: branched-chain amino acid ABC transporter permease/ATP-binding protein [Amycolatopsis sp.]|nr:branched-chain amino acid ABC transporter permease/ATP-binding protein [Amycolatopsis sp.]
MGVIQDGLLGLGTAAVYALLGQGMVLIYRGSGVLNFAHAALAAVGAYTFWELHIRHSWGFVPACVAAVFVAAVIGIVTHAVIMRPLRRRSVLARVAGTLGLLSILVGAILLIWGDTLQIVPSSLPQFVVKIGGVAVTADRLCLFGIAVVVTAGLYLITKFTRLGLAMTGVAENETATAALGWSPDTVAVTAWGAGSALAGLAGALVIPLTGLQVDQITSLITFATAAALLGGFYSFPLTLLAALVLGVASSELTVHTTNPNLATVVPLAVIIFTLVIRGTALPLRGYVYDRLPRLGRGGPRIVLTVVAVVVLSLLLSTLFGTDVVTAITNQLIAAIILLSLVLLTGYAGQVSLGQYAVAGCAAVYAAKLVTVWHWPFLAALVVGMLAATATGLLIGLPALRTRGVSLAVVTLGLGYVIETVVLTNSSVTGGIYGTFVGSQTVFGLDIDPILNPGNYAVVCVVALAIVALGLANLRRSRIGRRLVAIRDNERAAASVGISVTETKSYAFAAASAVAGLGGILLAFSNETVVYQNYASENSITSVASAVIGGIGYVVGPLIGSFIASGGLGALLLDSIGNLGNWLPVITGVALIGTLLATPDGQAAELVRLVNKAAQRLAPLRWATSLGRLRRRRGKRPESIDAPTGRVAGVRLPDRGTLSVEGLQVQLGGNRIVDDVSLQVRPGEIVGLIGPNGAGKTTVIDSISGFTRSIAGQVRLGTTAIGGMSAHQRVRHGVARSFQGLELFEGLSVLENIHAACEKRDRLGYLTSFVRAGRAKTPPIVWHALEQCGLLDQLDRYPEQLSYGQRRLVAIVRAVATGAGILLLDEPAAGLSHTETEELADLVTWLARDAGAGVLLVEHDVAMVMSVCDRIGVLQAGRLIASGAPAEVRENEEVVTAYLGA